LMLAPLASVTTVCAWAGRQTNAHSADRHKRIIVSHIGRKRRSIATLQRGCDEKAPRAPWDNRLVRNEAF
jgi:hypothetical protein